jgi:hypothetical protein
MRFNVRKTYWIGVGIVLDYRHQGPTGSPYRTKPEPP